MNRKDIIDLARSGLRMPIGADLVLRGHADAESIVTDGARLGGVILEAAARFRTPLAVGLMDLTLEKGAVLDLAGIAPEDAAAHHLGAWPGDHLPGLVDDETRPLSPRMQAHVDAVRHVAAAGGVVPVGMVIGPFSLMTKFLADPIMPVFLAGAGVGAEDDPSVDLAQRLLDLSTRMVLRSARAQLRAGARVLVVAEPAANSVFISPRQMDEGSDVFERWVMEPNRLLRALLRDAGDAQLFFHCCGDVTPDMVREFAALDPAVLSLGGSRRLWEDAPLVPETTVLFGNLPTKSFYSDEVMPESRVVELTGEILRRMAATGHPHILGSECDVLSVPGREAAIMAKVDAFLNSPA